ncbi:hypothetical protein [Spirosoma sordidisoli]|uniref:Uncharacterized protein n=1 Tax=Spirosoma sordidisoli TaxID=2502893 RepID=A0A4Q2UJG4_9BACT|nr:hypothetical protein [Spirosoma sordidisoli]RYC69627.1 hypothetical protein EQG79_13580 [Spirosoma sordidisoli]
MPNGIKKQVLGSNGTPTGEFRYYTESVAGSGVYDVLIPEPSSMTPARIGIRSLAPYKPEPVQVFNPQQFGVGDYYHPNFTCAIDFTDGKTVPERKALGINLFNAPTMDDAQKGALTFGEGMLYITESTCHKELEGPGVYESSLQTYFQKIWQYIPALGYGIDVGIKYAIFNIETSLGWGRDVYGQGGHWAKTWDQAKSLSIVCEKDGVTRTLEQLHNQGPAEWDREFTTRRANRMTLLLLVAREKGYPGLKVSFGASPYQGQPRIDFATGNSVFTDGACNVNHIGGSGNVITLNRPGGGTSTYTMAGNQWDYEDFVTGYYYDFYFDVPVRQDFIDIWVNKLPHTQNYPYIWSKMGVRHVFADEKGYIQLNRQRMLARQGVVRPFKRQVEPMYEANAAGIVAGQWVEANQGGEIFRVPHTHLQSSILYADLNKFDTPKVWQQPYEMDAFYCVTRFFAGNDEGWGFHMFPFNFAPESVRFPIINTNYYKHEMHTITAIHQARKRMQPYERYYTGSTLVEDPEVQINETGSWSAYSGTDAYNYNAGSFGVQKPSFMLRYKAVSGGWHVLIAGGMNQGWTTERTDQVRVPGGLLNGNKFRCKLRGPSVHIFEFFVRDSDTNQTYEAVPNTPTGWERPGYVPRIIS